MKFNKYIALGLLASSLGAGFTSCTEDFLNEELTTKYSTSYFETPQGLQDLTVSLYGHIRWWASYEGRGDVQTMLGTDEFGIGTDASNELWLTYDARLAPTTTTANGNTGTTDYIWDELYYGIASANQIIASADKISDEALRNSCLAQAYFLRGYNFYRLTAQYGFCVLQTVPPAGVIRSFERKTAEECWEQTISDLRTAYNLFQGEDYSFMGKGITWTKATAGHFLAKALLFAASERNADWNSSKKQAYLEEALEACNYVISARKLENDVVDVYGNWTGSNCAIESSDEILMAAPYDDQFTLTATRTGNRAEALFNPQFSNFASYSLGSYRGCLTGGKDFQRYRPTEYAYTIFDNVNDSRLWKTYRTVYGTAQNYTFVTSKEEEAFAANHLGEPATKIGDVSTVFIFNKKTDHTYDKFTFGAARYQRSDFDDEAGRLPVYASGSRQERYGATTLTGVKTPILNSWILYQNGKYVANDFGSTATNAFGSHGSNMFAGVVKQACGALNAFAGDNSSRDLVLARLSDTYLTRAEIKLRLGDYPGAKEDVNVIRKRAAWHQGENRAYQVDGVYAAAANSPYITSSQANIDANEGWNLSMNTYYLSNPDLDITYAGTENEMTNWTWDNLPAEDEAILQELGVSSSFDRALHFILNERTRELIGEFSRWETLSRTGTLALRAKKLNPDVKNFQEGKHELRPIPQTFIDGLLQDNGENLTDEQKSNWQNPGY